MNVIISPSKACGAVTAPPSKSMAHRYLIAAGLCQGTSVIENLSPSEDILATIDCLKAIGAKVDFRDNTAVITGTNPKNSRGKSVLPCRESGSTLRFFVPLCLLSQSAHTLSGYGRLMERPQDVYQTLCSDKGYQFQQTKESITVQGPLQGGNYTLPGNVSSQFITGLLYALPLTDCNSTITLIPPIESRSYIDLTISALQSFGIEANWLNDTTLTVKKGEYKSSQIKVEGDYSNAAFLDAYNYLGCKVQVNGLNPNSLQGDKVYQQGFAAMSEGTPTLSLANCPDLGPIYMAMAAALNGATFTNTERLKIKESDRGVAMANELAKFGIKTDLTQNTITVHPGRLTSPKERLDAHNDHRIVMALATLCTLVGGTITNAQAVTKSFPDYFTALSSLGVSLKEV